MPRTTFLADDTEATSTYDRPPAACRRRPQTTRKIMFTVHRRVSSVIFSACLVGGGQLSALPAAADSVPSYNCVVETPSSGHPVCSNRSRCVPRSTKPVTHPAMSSCGPNTLASSLCTNALGNDISATKPYRWTVRFSRPHRQLFPRSAGHAATSGGAELRPAY